MPLDYFRGPLPPDDRDLADVQTPSSVDRVRAAFGGRGELVAIPAGFDALLDVPGDAATTAAIEAALRYADLAVVRGRDASARGGTIELHVRAAELDRARDVAQSVVDRRNRLGH